MRALIAATAVLAAAGTASAGSTLYTPSVTGPGGAHHYECQISNVGTRAITVNSTLLGRDGGVVFTTGACVLAAGQSGCTAEEDGDAGNHFGVARCRFEVLDGSSRSVRAAIQVTRVAPAGDNWSLALPAE